MPRLTLFLAISCTSQAIALAASPVAQASEGLRHSSVGMPVRIEQLVLPGTELEAKPITDRKAPIVLRVVATYRHGTAFRYDLEYYGLEPGRFDLGDYLRRKDGSAADLPKLPVEVASLLPPGQVTPRELTPKPTPRLGAYRMLLAAIGVAWLAGLAAIVFYGRRRSSVQSAAAVNNLSLADRLRPLVDAALARQLSTSQQAELERLLLGYWCRRLGLEEVEPAAALAQLRADEQAGGLLRQVESWLHAPSGAQSLDIAAMLAPYRHIEDDDDPSQDHSRLTASSGDHGEQYWRGAGVAR